ncbi:MAG: serine hydrolase [Leptolyngbyaceae cyanobacterium bins.302]|nr:serine hydrolase [Leptolyngbyaceae cyanobacterium bins.302]
MAELGGTSRRAQRGGLGLFKRRRQPARSRLVSQPDTGTAIARRGDVCQMGDAAPAASKQRSGGWGWLFGKRAKSQRENSLRETSQRDRSRRSSSVAERRRVTGLPSPHLPAQRSHSSSILPLSSVPLSSQQSLERPLRSRDRRPSSMRLTPRSTRLQANQPTLIQASTSLQQNTLLQERDPRLEARRIARSRKREEFPVRPRSRSLAIALYAARMLILSVGVGVLAGTVLSAWNPATNPFLSDANSSIKQASSLGGKPSQPMSTTTQLPLSQELTAVKTAVQGVAQQYPGFTPGVFLIDLDTNNFMDWSGSNAFPAASTIKVPILIAFFQDVDAGKIRLDEKLTMRKELVAPESGDMQFLPVGAQFSALETATKMITISDNTATNMLIDRLGGIQALNERFKSWGLSATQLTNMLPDLKGTNTTSPKELASLMVRVSQGELVGLRSRDRLLDIMRRTINNSQLPQGLGEGASIAHKTGDIGIVIGDVGLIDMPTGKRYAAAVLIRRSPNDDRAYDLVAKISRTMYQHFVSAASPKRSANPPAPASTTPLKPELEPDDANTDAQNPATEAPNTPELNPVQAINP